MTNIERERLAVLAKEAAGLQKVWLREREEQRAMQVTANAEIRRRWVESDLVAVSVSDSQSPQAGRRVNRPLLSSAGLERKYDHDPGNTSI